MKYKKILLIDNFDSFTYNLVDYFKQLGCEVIVYRNQVTPEQLDAVDFDLLVLSPGPSVPKNAGNLFEIIGHFYQRKPIFGICLGLQALIEFFGGSLKFVPPHHGKADNITNDQKTIYTGLNPAIEIARYHSLAADEVPSCFEVSGRSNDGTVMSIRHKLLPIEAVQYHPESVLSMRDEVGMRIMKNVVEGRVATGNIHYTQLMQKVSTQEDLVEDDIAAFVNHIVDDQLTEDQKLILLVALSQKLQQPQNLNHFIKVLQAQNAYEINETISENGLDVCGTGGSGLPRFNTSTMCGVLLAHLGIPIIKHGNKAASGRFGSFDLLEVLGVPIQAQQHKIERAFKDTNLAFLYARKTHPIVGKFSNSRARMGVPTVFNVIGPLLNPYSPQRQFIGTSFAQFLDTIFETGILMGKEQLVVVRADDGLDEISISTTTQVRSFKDGKRKSFTLKPEDFGIETVPFDLLKCDNKQENIQIAEKMLEGNLDTEHYKLVAANAAFIYSEFKESMDLKEAYQLMVDTLKSGDLATQLEQYKGAVGDEIAIL